MRRAAGGFQRLSTTASERPPLGAFHRAQERLHWPRNGGAMSICSEGGQLTRNVYPGSGRAVWDKLYTVRVQVLSATDLSKVL